MSQLLVLSIRAARQEFKDAAHGSGTARLRLCASASSASKRMALSRQTAIALGHREADAALQGGLAGGALHEVFAEGGRHGAAATGFIAGLTARVSARRPLVWVRQDFCEIESGVLSMHGLAELGLDPRCVVTVRAFDVESALRTDGRCAGLRCARRCRAGGLGRGAAARSRRQPQADFGRTGLRRHCFRVAACGDAGAVDRGKPMDRARGAFAAGSPLRMGRAALRRKTCPQSSWPDRAMDHGMEM